MAISPEKGKPRPPKVGVGLVGEPSGTCRFPTPPRESMMARFFQITLSAVLVGLISVGCGGDDGGAGFASGAFGSSSGPPDSSGMIFDGVGAADALSDTEIAISWPSATNVEGTPAALMIYHVFRYLPLPGESFDSVPPPSEVTPGWNLISGNGTPPGVTSFIDTGLFGGISSFFWVRAEDPQGRKSLSLVVAGGHTPEIGAADTQVYSGGNPGDPHFEFSTMMDDAGRTCLTCHTVTPGLGSLDLNTWEGVMIGTGTASNPDSFVIPYQADMTWSNFLSGLTSNPAHHLLFLSQAADILAWETNTIGPWVEDGALNVVDLDPPVFEFDNIDNAGQYFAEFTAFDEVTVTWFQASDPESSPYGNGGQTAAGQLGYFLHYGPNSNSIDWDNPLGPFAWDGVGLQSAIISDYTESDIVIVIRAADKTDNWTTNEREIRLSR